MSQQTEHSGIKDAILDDVEKIVGSALPTRKARKRDAFDLLNSPVVITAIIGLIVNLGVGLWQYMSARSRHVETRRIELRARKEKVLTEFSDGMCQSLTLAQAYKYREAWLRIGSNGTNRYFDGRDFNETVKKAEEFKEQYTKLRMPDSLCCEVGSAFHSPSILRKLDSILKSCDQMIESMNASEINQAYIQINNDYKDLLHQMATELREDSK